MKGGYIQKFTKNPTPGCYAPTSTDKPKTFRHRGTRTRPANGGRACPHNVEEVICDIPGCKIDCVMTAWSGWSGCSTSCLEDGVKTRTRRVHVAPEWAGKKCPNPTEIEGCTTVSICLKVDCGYSAWTAWGPCAVSCGEVSEKGRGRTIKVKSQGVGKPCYDEAGDAIGLTEVTTCPSKACPPKVPAPSAPTMGCSSAKLRMREGAHHDVVVKMAESSSAGITDSWCEDAIAAGTASGNCASARMQRSNPHAVDAIDHMNSTIPGAAGIVVPTFNGQESDFQQWNSTSKQWVPCSDVKCKDGDCGDGNRYVDGNANGNGPGVYFVDVEEYNKFKVFQQWGVPSNFGVATVRTCTAWFIGARYMNGFLTAITDIKWDKGPLTKTFANQIGAYAAFKNKMSGLADKMSCPKVTRRKGGRINSGAMMCQAMGWMANKVLIGLKYLAQFIWTVVMFVTKLVFMILCWLQVKVQNANVYDLYLGNDRHGIRGDTPGIQHTPMTGGFFAQTWKEHFSDVSSDNNKMNPHREDAYKGGKGPAAAASVDNCVPKTAMPPIEWWRGWNKAYSVNGWKYLASCRGQISEKTITYKLAETSGSGNAAATAKTHSRKIKIVSYRKDTAFGWGFGNNNYPKLQAYLFPTCFTLNNAWLFKQFMSSGGADREISGWKHFAKFFSKLVDKDTAEEAQDCFKGKMGNRWRYNGEREYVPEESLQIGEAAPGMENTVRPTPTVTTVSKDMVKNHVSIGAITAKQVVANKKNCKESYFYKDATGSKRWYAKFTDVNFLAWPTAVAAAAGRSGGGVLAAIGMSTSCMRAAKDADAADAQGCNQQARITAAAITAAEEKVNAGGYDAVVAADLQNPTVCAPHAPYVYTANWGPATWNYKIIKLSTTHTYSGGDSNPLLANPIVAGDNAKEFSSIEWDDKYMNWARNQNNNGIMTSATGYDPELTRAEFDKYIRTSPDMAPSAGGSKAAAGMIFSGRNKKQTQSQNGSGKTTEHVPALSWKFFTDDSDPENRWITPLTQDEIVKKQKYKYAYRPGVKYIFQKKYVFNRLPAIAKKTWLKPGTFMGKIFGSSTNKLAVQNDDAVKWNHAFNSGSGGKLRLCVGGMLRLSPQIKTARATSLLTYKAVTQPKYRTRGPFAPAHSDRCMGLAVVDMRPTSAGRMPFAVTFIGGTLARNTGLTSIAWLGEKLSHYRQRKPYHMTTPKGVISKGKIDAEVLTVFKAIPNAPGYSGGSKASSCMKLQKSIFGKDCKTWLQPLEVVLSAFVCDDMSFGITIRSGSVDCATPYLTSVSPHVDEATGDTALVGADLAFPFTVSLSFKFWLKSTWYVCIMVPILLYAIEAVVTAVSGSGGSTIPWPYNIIEFEMGFGVAWHDWGKAAIDNEDNSWYFKFCFQKPVMGPLMSAPACTSDAAFVAPIKQGASCPFGDEIKVFELNPQLSVALQMKLLGVCSYCGKYDISAFWNGKDALPDWNCMKVGMVTPQQNTGTGSAPSGHVRNADGDCNGVTISLGKSVGRTGRARMAYAKQSRCALAQDSCHDALESKDNSALTACLKDALSSRIQCDATARLDPYPSNGNLFAKEMDVFMGPNMGPDSATSMAALRAGYAQGLGSLRVERLSVQLAGSESDVKLRMNATVAPATAVQLRDVCWNWDDAMMKDVRHAKADKYTTSKQKGRFLVAAVQWHLKNGSGLDQKTRENMQDWVVMVKDMGAMGFLQKDPSVESREANTLSAHTSKMCSKLPLTGLRAELQMDVTSLGSGETAGQFSGSLRKFTVPLVEQAYHRTTQAQRAVESMLGGKRRFADVFGKIMREAKNIMDKEAQYLMKATCTELRVLCPTCSDEAWECGL